MEVTLLNRKSDLTNLKSWWEKRDHVVIPSSMLSDYGILVSKDGVDIAAMFLYPVVSTDWCMVRFPISNPEVEASVRDEAMDLVFDSLFLIAKDLGYKKVFCTTDHKNLSKRLLKFNFINMDVKCDHFWGDL